MKNFTKEAVAKVFKMNPGYSTLYFTADGKSFISENYAKQYARENDLADKTITPVDAEVDFEESPEVQKTTVKVIPVIPKADDLINTIKGFKTLAELTAFVLPEGEKRATVLKAVSDKTKELEDLRISALVADIHALTTVEGFAAFELPEGEKSAEVIKALSEKKKELGVE